VSLPADNVAVLLPKSMTFTAGSGSAFKSVAEEPGVMTFLAKNAVPGKVLEFTLSGTGSIPRDAQGSQAGQQPATDNGTQSQDASAPASQPGGGIGNPIGTPDPLSKYKWWILGGLALLLAAGAAFLLRKPATEGAVAAATEAGALAAAVAHSGGAAYPPFGSTEGKNAALLNALKEELFALESAKLSGTLAPGEYEEVKAALETVLKRALKRSS
jgi:ribosomal protein L29